MSIDAYFAEQHKIKRLKIPYCDYEIFCEKISGHNAEAVSRPICKKGVYGEFDIKYMKKLIKLVINTLNI